MTSSFQIHSENCLMCDRQVMRKIAELQGVFGADVNYAKNVIHVQHTDEVTTKELEVLLDELGLFKESNECQL